MEYVTRCKKCGKFTSVDTSKVLTTYPAQYGYTCEHCGGRDTCFTYEAEYVNEIPNQSRQLLKSKEEILIDKLQGKVDYLEEKVEELMDRVRRLENDR